MKLFLQLWLYCIVTSSIAGQVTVDFSTSDREGCEQLLVSFFDQSYSTAGPILAWSWTYESGSSHVQNPGVIFNDVGLTYTVCLEVTDIANNTASICKEDFIIIHSIPDVDFLASEIQGCNPLEVLFTDLTTSDGDIISWIWDLGGAANVIQITNPENEISSTYEAPGSYSVSLTVEDDNSCSNTILKPNFIQVSEIWEPLISISISYECDLPWVIDFVIQNPQEGVEYLWDLGNGQSSEGDTIYGIIYDELGMFDIEITASDDNCVRVFEFDDYINTDPINNITLSHTEICLGEGVQFNYSSFLQYDSLEWNFGNNNFSTEDAPFYSFMEDGIHEISLVSFIDNCTDTILFPIAVEVYPLPEFNVDIGNLTGCTIPHEVNLSASSPDVGNYIWSIIHNDNTTTILDSSCVFIAEKFGTFQISLMFTNDRGCSIDTILDPIVISQLDAHLPHTLYDGCIPLNIKLEDSLISNFQIDNYEWTIFTVPPLVSTDSSPTFTVQDTGSFDVQLIIFNEHGCFDTVIVENYIKAGIPPEVDFIVNPIDTCASALWHFTSIVSDFTEEWIWQFGNDSISFLPHPEIQFNEIGSMDVGLTATHNGCTSTIQKIDFINLWPPTASFSVEYNCDDPLSITALDKSLGADSIVWNFHLSETETITSFDSVFSIIVPDRGKYLLSLNTYNDSTGCHHFTQDTLTITTPVANYTVDTTRICFPGIVRTLDHSLDAAMYEYSSFNGHFTYIYRPNTILNFNDPGAFIGPLLTVTDIHGCQDEYRLPDSIYLNAVTAIPGYIPVICIPDSVAFMDASTSLFGEVEKWEWNIGPDQFLSDRQSFSAYFDEVRKFDLNEIVTDSWSCTDNIFIPDAIESYTFSIDFSADTLGCTWSGIQFNSETNNTFGSSYFWEFGDGTVSNDKHPYHYYDDQDIYSVCLTVISSNGCTQRLCKDSIINILNPVSDFVGDPLHSTCPPLLTGFDNNSSNAIEYIWDFGDESGTSLLENPSHVYTAPGSYGITLIATLNDKCQDTLFLVDYIEIGGPLADFEMTIDSSCIPLEINLKAESNGNYNYVWDYGNGILDTVPRTVDNHSTDFIYTDVGVYTPRLIVTDPDGCTRSFSGSPVRADTINPDFSILDPLLCGLPAEVIVNNLATASNEISEYWWKISGPETYYWEGMTPTFTLTQVGSYHISLKAKVGYCIDSLAKENAIVVDEYPQLSFTTSEDQLCEFTGVNFINQSSPQSATWLWDLGNGNTSTDVEPNSSIYETGDYLISLTGTSFYGCESNVENTIHINDGININIGSDSLICLNESIELNSDIVDSGDLLNFYWIENDDLSCTQCLNTVASPTDTVIYYFIADHNNGCQSLDSIIIYVAPIPSPEIELIFDDIICQEDSTLILINNPLPNVVYQFQGNTIECLDSCSSVLVNQEEPTYYTIDVINQYGCQTSTEIFVDIESHDLPILNEDRTICYGDSVQLEIESGYNPHWSYSEYLSCLDCLGPYAIPQNDTEFIVEVESELGCKYSDTLLVEVIPIGLVDAGINDTICYGEEIHLLGQGFGDVEWTPSTFLSDASVLDPISTPSSDITYILRSSKDLCTRYDTLEITVNHKTDIEVYGDSICPGEIALINALGWTQSFEWYDENGAFLSNDAEVYVQPEHTLKYQVIGSRRSCENDTAYATVFVHEPIDVEMETDVTIYANLPFNFEVIYDENNDYIFHWSPPEGLSCTTCPNPTIANLESSLNYELEIIDLNSGCQLDTLILARYINDCTEKAFYLPNIFSPNEDGVNDGYRIFAFDEKEFISLSIFDRWGGRLFSTTEISETWDGNFHGSPLSLGVYVILVNAICTESGERYGFASDITIVR